MVRDALRFACTCGDSRREVEEIRAWAMKYLGATPENFLDQVVWKLNWYYNASITGIYNDQWSMVAAETQDMEKVGEAYQRVNPPTFSTSIQCDRVEDGIAYTLRAFWERFGDKRDESEGGLGMPGDEEVK